jgi:cytidylate kinase
MAIITISRLTGSGGREIALAIAEKIGFQFVDGEAMDAVIAQQFPVRGDRLTQIKDNPRIYDSVVRSAIAELAAHHNVIVLGGGGQFLFAKLGAALHVQIVAPLPYRIARVMHLAKIERGEAEKIVANEDESKRKFIQRLYGANWRDPAYYDLVLNIDSFSNDVAVDIIVKAASAKGIETKAVELPVRLREDILTAKLDVAQLTELETSSDKLPEFAHPSEREFARVMDFYRIRWEYEPRTFPIEWDDNHNATAAFTPDFFLPDLDLYIELTTMKQSLVTKKNRKIRRLRELYPEVNIKVLYERDYRNLIWKYGLSA